MNEKLERAQSLFMDHISKMCNDFGLNSFIARLYAVLYLNNRPMSLDEISESLGVSKGNVSVNIRELQRWGAVRKIWMKGSRKDYYEAQQNIKKLILSKIGSSIQKRLDDSRSMIKEFNDILSSVNEGSDKTDTELVKIYKEKLKDIEEVVNLGHSILKIATTFIPKAK